MKRSHPYQTLAIAFILGMLLLGGTVYSATTNILAVGTIPDSKLFDGPATVTVRTLTIAPGETLAWHYHPGYAFNVVKSGTLTVEDGCGGQEETLTPGQAFEEMDGRVHRAKNLGTVDVVVYNTFIVPQGKPTTVNIPANERRCGPPEDVDECKDDGWLKFTHPQSFTDQGECVSFVRHRPRNTIPVPQDPLN
jgi:quercetin dioxygenase-like cupin family protein